MDQKKKIKLAAKPLIFQNLPWIKKGLEQIKFENTIETE